MLITDDPDDHNAFSEALSDLTTKVILIVISNSEKALEMLKSKKHRPDYLIIDLSMYGIRVNSFITTMKNDIDLADIPIYLYGDKSDTDKVKDNTFLPFFSKEYNYSELRSFLKNIIQSNKE